MPAFDWYQATVPVPVNDLLECLDELAPDLVISHARGMHGYATTAGLGNVNEGSVAKVWHGGTHPHPHVVLSGRWAAPGAELIRARFPEHSVSRLDVRQDFNDEGAFDSIQGELLRAAKHHRVSVRTAGDHLLTMKGRTTYLGAPSSAVQLKVYDKAAEVLAKLPPCGPRRQRAWSAISEGFPKHWTRLEAMVRPATKEARTEYSRLQPVEALGCTQWMRDVWGAVAGLELEPAPVGRGYRVTDDERAYRFLLLHYGPLLRRMHGDQGSWECVGRQIGDDLADRH